MNEETWGALAQPPATLIHLRRRRLIKAYRRHREDVEIRNFVATLRKVQQIQRQRALDKADPARER